MSKGHAERQPPATSIRTGSTILFGVLFLGVSDTQLIPPLLPLIARDLEIDPGRAGLAVTVYALAAATCALVSGAASDRIGRKRLIVGALAAFSVASLATSQSTHFSTLLAARLLTGLSAGALSTLALSYAADLYPYEKRGRAMGILSMSYFLAFVVGIPTGSLVAEEVGWRWVFRGLAVLTALVLWLMAFLLPSDRTRALVRAVPTLIGHFRNRDRLAGIIAAFLTSGGLVGFITYVGVWLDREGIGVASIGFLLMAAGISATLASPTSGWIADRTGKRSIIIFSNALLAPVFVLTSHIDWSASLFIAICLLAILAAARQGPLHALTTELVGERERGSYVAVRNAASQLGIAVIAAVAAAAFDRNGFVSVAWVSAAATALLIPVCLLIREP